MDPTESLPANAIGEFIGEFRNTGHLASGARLSFCFNDEQHQDYDGYGPYWMTVATRKKWKLDKQTGKTIQKNLTKEELCASWLLGWRPIQRIWSRRQWLHSSNWLIEWGLQQYRRLKIIYQAGMGSQKGFCRFAMREV
jgi:hypothetical protein